MRSSQQGHSPGPFGPGVAVLWRTSGRYYEEVGIIPVAKADPSLGCSWVLGRGGLAAGAIGYKAQHQASEARRSAKRSFAPTIGFAGLCLWFASKARLCAPVRYPLIGPGHRANFGE